MASLFPSQLEADIQLDAILADVATKQSDALADTGKYDQYCCSVTTVVDDPETGEPREVVSREMLNETRQLSGATLTVTLGVYESAMGVGYAVLAVVDDGAVLWQRVVNVGNETYREQPWQEMMEV